MSADELHDLLHAEPFRPFTVYLADDQVLQIADPELVMLTPEGQTLVVAEDLSDKVEMVDVALITRVEVEAS